MAADYLRRRVQLHPSAPQQLIQAAPSNDSVVIDSRSAGRQFVIHAIGWSSALRSRTTTITGVPTGTARARATSDEASSMLLDNTRVVGRWPASQALGCAVVDVPAGATVPDLLAGYAKARELASAERRPAVLVCPTHPSSWTESGAWCEVGVPAGLSGRAAYEETKAKQLHWTT